MVKLASSGVLPIDFTTRERFCRWSPVVGLFSWYYGIGIERLYPEEVYERIDQAIYQAEKRGPRRC